MRHVLWQWLALDLRALGRDKASVWGGVAVGVAAGLGPTRFHDFDLKAMLAPPVAEVDESWSEPCDDTTLPSVSWDGPVPPWVAWPAPFTPALEADVLVRAGVGHPPEIEVLPLHDAARPRQVEACLEERAEDELGRRLDHLGITERRDSALVRVESFESDGPTAANPARSLSALLLGASAIVVIGVLGEYFPHQRATGALEALFALPVERRWLLVRALLLSLAVSLAMTALVLVSATVGGALWTPLETGPHVWALALALPLVSLGLAQATLPAPDLRSSAARALPVLLGAQGLVLAAIEAEHRWTGMGALVPVGGVLAYTAGLLSAGEWPAILVNGTLSLGVLGWRAVRIIDGLDITASPSGLQAARRAQGRYGPEVALLMALGVAGSTTWIPGSELSDDIITLTLVSQILFYATPAFLTPWALGLDKARLLAWTRPSGRAWAAAVMWPLGTVPLALVATEVGVRVFDVSAVELAAYESTLLGDVGPVAIVTLTVIPGVCEELLFRGALFGLLRRRGGLWVAFAIQALLFSVMHVMAFKLLPTAVGGLALGLLAIRTGSILPGMLAHALHNAGGVFLPPEWVEPLTTSTGGLFGLFCGGLALLAVAWWLAGPPRQKLSVGTRNEGPVGLSSP